MKRGNRKMNTRIVRMRTCDGIYEELREMDPKTQISRHFIYQLMVQQKVNTVFAGNKRLANLDEVLEYLKNPPLERENKSDVVGYGKLRQIN